MSVSLQIELDEMDAILLQQEAARQCISVSELIRRCLRQIPTTPPESLSDEEYDADPIWSLAGQVRSGTADGSENHDKYIYDQEV